MHWPVGLADINPYMNDPYWGLTAEEQADFYAAFLEQSVHPAFDKHAPGLPAQPLDRNHVLQPDLVGRIRLMPALQLPRTNFARWLVQQPQPMVMALVVTSCAMMPPALPPGPLPSAVMS